MIERAKPSRVRALPCRRALAALKYENMVRRSFAACVWFGGQARRIPERVQPRAPLKNALDKVGTRKHYGRGYETAFQYPSPHWNASSRARDHSVEGARAIDERLR